MLLSAVLLLATAAAPDAVSFEKTVEEFFRTGRYDRALDFANRELENDTAPDALRAHHLLARSRACIELHDRDCALAALDDAEKTATARRDLALLARVYRDRGFATWTFEHDAAHALALYDVAIADARASREWPMLITALHLSGNMLRRRKPADLEGAMQRYQEARAIAERVQWGTAHIWHNIGDTYAEMHRSSEAEDALRRAAEEADGRDVAEVRWQARLGLALLASDHDRAAAARYFEECLHLLEEQQSDVLLEDLRPGVFAAQMTASNPYDAYIDFLLGQNRSADAFLVAERERARVFLESLAASRAIVAPRVSRAYAAAERDALGALKRAQSELRVGHPHTMAAVEAAENRLNAVRLRLAVDEPSLGHARYPKLWTIRELRSQVVRRDEGLLVFYCGAKRSVAWLVTRDTFDAFLLPPVSAIDAAARAAIDEARDPASTNGAAIEKLSQTLAFDRIGSAIRFAHLVVVPHGTLNVVPFEALRIAPGRTLIEATAVSYAPSASSLAFLRQRDRNTAGSVELLAVGNPIVSGKAQTTRQFDLAAIHVLAPLPHTASEVRSVAGLFAPAARILEGPDATLPRLNRFLARARIVHFATHGLIDEARPDRSGLLLTASSPTDDGLLQVRDVYRLRLNADLVTLSACDTARGQNITGEGMIGLTRAFFFAGAHSVVATLWDVDDATTADLMKRFYANIRGGDAVDVALKKAKIHILRRGGRSSAPFFWAAFVASGDARIAIEPARPPFVAIAIALLVAGAAIAAGVRMRRAATSRAAGAPRSAR